MNKILPELNDRMKIYGIVRGTNATGSVLDGSHWKKGRLKSVRLVENISNRNMLSSKYKRNL